MSSAEESYLMHNTLYGIWNSGDDCEEEYDPGAEADAQREMYYDY